MDLGATIASFEKAVLTSRYPNKNYLSRRRASIRQDYLTIHPVDKCCSWQQAERKNKTAKLSTSFTSFFIRPNPFVIYFVHTFECLPWQKGIHKCFGRHAPNPAAFCLAISQPQSRGPTRLDLRHFRGGRPRLEPERRGMGTIFPSHRSAHTSISRCATC
jgi:hypothetical protein